MIEGNHLLKAVNLRLPFGCSVGDRTEVDAVRVFEPEACPEVQLNEISHTFDGVSKRAHGGLEGFRVGLQLRPVLATQELQKLGKESPLQNTEVDGG
jgi:hypothetical protein